MIQTSVWCVVLTALIGVQSSVAWDHHADNSLLRRALKGGKGEKEKGRNGPREGDFNMTDANAKSQKGGNETAPGIRFDAEDGRMKGFGNETDFDSGSGDDSMDSINGTDASADFSKKDKSAKGHGGRKHSDSEDGRMRGFGNETEFDSGADMMDDVNGTDASGGFSKKDKSTKGHGGRKRDFTGNGGRDKSRGPFGIEYAAVNCTSQNTTEAECTVREGEPGAWVCRTLYDVVTGKPYSFSTCIDLEESIGSSNDVCGCCGECPAACTCPCDDGEGKDGFVKVLDAENPEDGGHCVNPKMAKRMTSGAGLLGPRHICDVSCK